MSGMATLLALMAIKRSPKASPWRFSGVIWCKVLMIMGCTEPNTNPKATEHMPMVIAVGMNG